MREVKFLLLGACMFLLLGITQTVPAMECTQIVAGFVNPTHARATDDFLNLVDNAMVSTASTQADVDEFTVPVDVVISNLAVSDVTDPGTAGDTWDIYVLDDGVKTALTCEVANGETTCFNLSQHPFVLANSDLVVMIDSGEGDSDPAPSGNMRISFCIRPY